MNSYLKEIADCCGIKKNLSTHTGRHTFCPVATPANNVSLENIAKMVGHTNTRMTQRYAKILEQSILRDMLTSHSIAVKFDISVKEQKELMASEISITKELQDNVLKKITETFNQYAGVINNQAKQINDISQGINASSKKARAK